MAENPSITEQALQIALSTGRGELIAALDDLIWLRRPAIATALGRIGGDRAVSALIGLLGDRGEKVRAAAARALGRIGDPVAVEPLRAAHSREEGREVRVEMNSALKRLQRRG